MPWQSTNGSANAAAMKLYQENIRWAQFKPVPERLLAIPAAVRENQEETNRFFMARKGMISPDEFFNLGNIERLLACAASSTPGRQLPQELEGNRSKMSPS
jgi:hypothetical protein